MNTKTVVHSITNEKPFIDQIREFISDGGSYRSGVIHAIVSQKMKIKGNPLYEGLSKAERPEITKEIIYHCALNGNYSNAVNNQRVREGKEADFEAQSNWHEKAFDWFNGTVVRHRTKTDQFYLLIQCQYSKTLRYFINGNEADAIEKKLIEEWKESSTPTNQGTDRPIIARTIALDNILSIRCGDELVLSGSDEEIEFN